tara:strand:+ start:2568 stop:2840 length:273 start_codon:yes stop_codon:yes gene_type:complete
LSDKEEALPSEPVIKERRRGKERSNSFLSSLGIDLSSIGVEIRLKDEDKEMLQNALQEISDKVDYRWKVTQGIMIAAILLGIVGQVINWL